VTARRIALIVRITAIVVALVLAVDYLSWSGCRQEAAENARYGIIPGRWCESLFGWEN
jgi:hypothetical protein